MNSPIHPLLFSETTSPIERIRREIESSACLSSQDVLVYADGGRIELSRDRS